MPDKVKPEKERVDVEAIDPFLLSKMNKPPVSYTKKILTTLLLKVCQKKGMKANAYLKTRPRTANSRRRISK